MSVRPRKWITRSGKPRECWIVAYADTKGKRHIESFERKKEADARHAEIKAGMARGTHTVINRTATISTAAGNWIKYLEGEDREVAYIAGCKQHIRSWIEPKIGHIKLASLTTVAVNEFRDELLASEISRNTAKKILVSLKSIITDARRRGHLNSNPADGVTIKIDPRTKKKLEIGVDIPTREEVARIIAAATGRARPFFHVTVFTGLRASEIRGLRWSDVDLEKGEIHVRQRMDRYNKAGAPKSVSSSRTIPIGPQVVNVLKEWRLACPKGTLNLVFPNGKGNVQTHANVYHRIVRPTLAAADITKMYGPHSFRHFFASWCSARKVEGGRELPLLAVSRLMGHSSVTITADRYSHLFPRQDDAAELAAAELGLIPIPTSKGV
jgi:integrase